MAATWIIDADSHVTEPPDLWTSRVARKHVDHVPRVEVDDHGAEFWSLEGVRIATIGTTAPAGWPGFPVEKPPTIAECLPAAYDARARLDYLDEARIWAQVLFPNVAGFGSQRFLTIDDRQLQLDCVRAYNDFLAEWASADPHRLVTIMALPFWDVPESIREIERCIPLGFRGLLFTGEPQRFGLPPLGAHMWDPLWTVAEDAGLPVHFHIGGGEDSPSMLSAAHLEANGRAGAEGYTATSLFLKNAVQCADLICSGVLPRYPELKFVSVESGIGWVPFMLEAVDYSYLGAATVGRRRTADLLPSELFARQVYTTYWFEQVAPSLLLGAIPTDRILFETDFPHTACLYENIDETIERGLADASPEDRRRILWDNAAELYRVNDPRPGG